MIAVLAPAAITPDEGDITTIADDDNEKLRLTLLSLNSSSVCAGGALPPMSPLKLNCDGEKRQGGVVPLPTVMVALADLVGSATLVAVKMHVIDAVLGAVYVRVLPEPVMNPQLDVNDQLTDVLVAPVTEAANECVPPGATVAVAGLIDTVTAGWAE